MSTPLAIELLGVRRGFARSGFALEVDRLEVPAGSSLALLGPSGSGKSTLLHLLALLEAPDAGSVRIGGREVTPADRDVRLQIAAVFQRPYLFKGSVLANVAYGLKVRGVERTERERRATAAFETVGLAGYETRGVAQLSGGEAQRVSLARALAIEPRVLLLDEPLASLDPLLRRQLARDFARIARESGATTVWVTHDQDEALIVADRTAVLRDGRIAAHGSADDVMALPVDEWTAAFLGVAAAQRGRVVGSADGLVEIAVGEARVFASGEAEIGAEVHVAVRPEDVLLFAAGSEMPVTTARNRLPARVTSLEPRGATLYATLDAGGALLASTVSRAAATELALATGTDTLAVFKATAVRWRPIDNG